MPWDAASVVLRKAGSVGAQPLRGECEGSPLTLPLFLGVGAEQRKAMRSRWTP
jgi:hypothetical protein